MTMYKKLILAGLALAALIAFSPAFELSQVEIDESATVESVGEAIIVKTCFERHGYNLIDRWSCHSKLRPYAGQITTVCLNNDGGYAVLTDVCANFTQLLAVMVKHIKDKKSEAAMEKAK